MRVGYALSSEEHPPGELVRQARLAEQHGFSALWISDHFHPWNGAQGNAPFVWSVIGALSQATRLPVTTAVTCPTIRLHPAIVAQAAATSGCLVPGGFRLGVGTGEALNEHVVGARWPVTDVRLEMLEEAVSVIRKLFTGEVVNHHGRHYTVEDARLYTVPEHPVPIYVSGFGPKAIDVAARIGDGFVSTSPDAESVHQYRRSAGTGPAEAAFKVCWGADRDAALRLANQTWFNEQLPGELAQVLPSPQHFEQAASLVTEEATEAATPCGPDPEPYLQTFRSFAEAGYDTVHITQIGPDQDGFFDFFTRELRPRLGDVLTD